MVQHFGIPFIHVLQLTTSVTNCYFNEKSTHHLFLPAASTH